MPPKKKVEEEAPAPEECLPAGFSIGCQVYWIEEDREFEDTGELLKCAQGGQLHAVPELAEHQREDGSTMYCVESVEVQFDGLQQPHKVAIKSIGLQPPPMEILRELSTGLKLPLTGRDVERVWAVQSDFDKQAKLVTKLLDLDSAFSSQSRREIVCDFHIFNLTHAKSICLTSLQAAAFLSIMQKMLVMMSSQPVTVRSRPSDLCTVSTCFKEFERLILMHSVNDPPERLEIFRGSEVRLLTDFSSMTLFKHFLLYQYCANFEREVQTLRFAMSVERPLPLLDLNAATLKPSRSRSQEAGEGAARDAPPEAAAEVGESTEEQEIERLVRERLRETEAALEAKLAAREGALLARLEEEAARAPPRRGR